MNHFFLANFLPPISVSVKPDITFLELAEHFRMNLSPSEMKAFDEIRYYLDLCNTRALEEKRAIDERGSLSEKGLDEALQTKCHFPDTLFDEGYSQAISEFFLGKHLHPFLTDYFKMEREIKLLLAGYRAKEQNRNLAEEMPWEDPRDLFFSYILAQKDAPHFEFPFEYRDLADAVEGSEPITLFKQLSQYRYDRIQELMEEHPFSLGYLLGYSLQLMLAEDQHTLNDQKGSSIIYDNISNR